MINPELEYADKPSDKANHFLHRRSMVPASFVNQNMLRFTELHETITLCTGSTYTGGWNQFGMHGKCEYVFPDGLRFIGRVHNGHFHGSGKLLFPNGHSITGEWEHGISSNLKFQFADGLDFDENDWDYCRKESCRRFLPDDKRKLYGIGRHRTMTARMSTHPIPKDCYNTGEGFYNPKTKCLYSLDDPTEMVRIPTVAEERWIVENCPRHESARVGFRKDLFEPNEYRELEESLLAAREEC